MSRRRRPAARTATTDPATGTIRVLPLGGLGEIGKNMSVVEYDGRILVVDAGVRFPTAEMHGIDLVLPDFTYLRDRRDRIDAFVITHGHEDHLGALPWVLRDLGLEEPPMVVGRELTVAMARSKLDEHKLKNVPTTVLEGRDSIEVGPFTVELVHMTHSIPHAAAALIGTPSGRVLFSGDYRFDQTPVDGRPADFARLAQIGDEGLLLLCGDSTNADRAGIAPSEADIGPALQEVLARCEGRAIVTSFASNIHRVQQVITAAETLGRNVTLLGRSMAKNVRIARSLGLIEVSSSTLVDAREVERLPDDKVVVMTTGSQGEPLSALTRMASEDHRQIRLREGDTVIYSATPIPGNERAIEETVDRLARLGCRIVTARDAPIHTSGHGYREELKLLLNLVRPRYLMPVHGDTKRLQLHAELGRAVGLADDRIFVGANGLPLDVDADRARFSSPVQAGMILVDGFQLGDPTDAALRDRRSLSQDGVVFLVATIAQQDGETLAPPEVVLRGMTLHEPEDRLVEAIREEVEDVLDRAFEEDATDIPLLEQALHDGVAAFLHKRTGRRPMLLPVVVEV
ncbi:MAG: ribonuclease J [Candidatus Nanopelagicales bacterium]